MHNPDLLVSRILKARYFLNGSFLEANEGANPSYTWKSILEGRKTLKKGLVWRVGNGFNINIWRDPWIPNNANFNISTPEPDSPNVTKVHKLILDNPPRWNDHLLSTIFFAQDRKELAKILLTLGMEDSVYWIHEPKGYYTVKSGYK